MSYVAKLQAMNDLQATRPPREYITKEQYSQLKGALTRAKNSGDGRRVLRAVEDAIQVFDETTWPDDWPMWRIALEDAAAQARYKDDDDALAEELYAASLILFRL